MQGQCSVLDSISKLPNLNCTTSEAACIVCNIRIPRLFLGVLKCDIAMHPALFRQLHPHFLQYNVPKHQTQGYFDRKTVHYV